MHSTTPALWVQVKPLSAVALRKIVPAGQRVADPDAARVLGAGVVDRDRVGLGADVAIGSKPGRLLTTLKFGGASPDRWSRRS